MFIQIQTYIHINAHIYIHTYIHASLYTFIHKYIQIHNIHISYTQIHTYIHTGFFDSYSAELCSKVSISDRCGDLLIRDERRVRRRAPKQARGWMLYIRYYIRHTYIHTFIQNSYYTRTFIHTKFVLHTYIYRFILHIHIHIHTCIHTYIQQVYSWKVRDGTRSFNRS